MLNIFHWLCHPCTKYRRLQLQGLHSVVCNFCHRYGQIRTMSLPHCNKLVLFTLIKGILGETGLKTLNLEESKYEIVWYHRNADRTVLRYSQDLVFKSSSFLSIDFPVKFIFRRPFMTTFPEMKIHGDRSVKRILKVQKILVSSLLVQRKLYNKNLLKALICISIFYENFLL